MYYHIFQVVLRLLSIEFVNSTLLSQLAVVQLNYLCVVGSA